MMTSSECTVLPGTSNSASKRVRTSTSVGTTVSEASSLGAAAGLLESAAGEAPPPQPGTAVTAAPANETASASTRDALPRHRSARPGRAVTAAGRVIAPLRARRALRDVRPTPPKRASCVRPQVQFAPCKPCIPRMRQARASPAAHRHERHRQAKGHVPLRRVAFTTRGRAAPSEASLCFHSADGTCTAPAARPCPPPTLRALDNLTSRGD